MVELESHLKLFVHVRRRLLETLVVIADMMENSPILLVDRDLEKTVSETNKKDLDLNVLSIELVYMTFGSIECSHPPSGKRLLLLL